MPDASGAQQDPGHSPALQRSPLRGSTPQLAGLEHGGPSVALDAEAADEGGGDRLSETELELQPLVVGGALGRSCSTHHLHSTGSCGGGRPP